MAKVIVGMSGGVDSSVTAYLLKMAGYDVVGITLRTWHAEDGTESRCCEIDDARRVAWKLDIPYYAMNCISDFRKRVTTPFMNRYICGMTPNPCIECNRYIKWEKMIYFARIIQADYIATGHYASVIRLDNGQYTVKKAAHAKKDQTYMLYKLTQEQLKSTLMPLGNLSKEEVRRIAEQAGLSVAEKPDSQEICFVTEGDYADYIRNNYPGDIPGGGYFVDEQGAILGMHRGIIHYTVGQRKGLGLPLEYPAYVTRIHADRNEIVIGGKDSLYSDTLICGNVNFMSIPAWKPGEILHCYVKIRYHHTAQEALVEGIDHDKIRIRFEKPVRAAAPGQSAVLYDRNDCVIGGGIILEAF